MKSVPVLVLAVSCVMATESLNTQHVFHQLGCDSAPCKHYHLQGKYQEIRLAREKHNTPSLSCLLTISEWRTLLAMLLQLPSSRPDQKKKLRPKYP